MIGTTIQLFNLHFGGALMGLESLMMTFQCHCCSDSFDIVSFPSQTPWGGTATR